MEDQVTDHSPLIGSHSSYAVHRTGNVWNGVAHIITGVIGAGVLALAWSIAQLGWVAGPLLIILFAIATLVSSTLLSDCHRFPHPQHQHETIRTSSLTNAVKLSLGETREKVCGVLTYVFQFGTAVAYVVTSATSAKSR